MGCERNRVLFSAESILLVSPWESPAPASQEAGRAASRDIRLLFLDQPLSLPLLSHPLVPSNGLTLLSGTVLEELWLHLGPSNHQGRGL